MAAQPGKSQATAMEKAILGADFWKLMSRINKALPRVLAEHDRL